MQKIIVGVFVFMFLCFGISNFFCIGLTGENKEIRNIKLLITSTNEVVEMSLDDYIIGVLIGEVPSTYEDEALKAQAIVARTYTLYKLQNSPDSHENADMCDDINHCQAYKTKEYAMQCWDDDIEKVKWSKLENAVKSTSGKVITYKDNLINAFFHAHSGGMTEDVKYIWGKEEIPYLKSVKSEEGYLYEDKVVVSKSDFFNIVKNKYNDFDDTATNYSVDGLTPSGRVDKMTIGNKTLAGTEIRTLYGLRSTYFTLKEEDENIIFTTNGYGHGIGMSQEGANYMAINGSSCEDIIKHYYTDVDIVSI